MPEPSEIDLLQDKVQNPLQLIEKYKNEKGIKTDKSIVDLLNNIFDDVESVINKYVSGSKYKSELMEVIKSYCDVRLEDIHVNDVYKNTQIYA